MKRTRYSKAVARVIAAVALSALAEDAVAQSSSRSSWGVVGSFVPQRSWQTMSQLKIVFNEDERVDISGTDFSIGVARGRENGGDWGVSYIRKTIQDGSRLDGEGGDCFNDQCLPAPFMLTRGVTLSGIEAHRFVPVAMIKDRVQIGLNFAGGVGKFNGDLEVHESQQDITFLSNGQVIVLPPTESVTIEPAKTELTRTNWFPLGKVQAAVAAIVAPNFKVRVAGGFDFPGYQVFSVTGVYFFRGR